MRTNITTALMCLLLLSMFMVSNSQAQVYAETGKVGVRMDDYGAIRIYSPTTNDDRQIARISIVAALSESDVSDYYEDHDSTMAAYLIAPSAIADTELVAEFNSNYSEEWPKVLFRLHVFTWANDPFVIARYTAINDSNQQVTLHFGMLVVPQVAGSYGAETDNYNSDHTTAYTYRSGDTYYSGIRWLSLAPASYHALDWDVYSPDDAENDAATDSTRYHMTVDAGFDGSLVAGGNGSVFSLNTGGYVLAPGDSVVLYLAIASGAGETALLEAADAAQTKYNSLFTSIAVPPETGIPSSLQLQQNYPNPFNPNTSVQFALNAQADIQLNVYNLNGQYINTIASGTYNAGSYLASWNGKDSRGNDVASGIYLYRLISGNSSLTRKMILIR